MPRDIEQLSVRMQRLLSDRTQLNLHAQAHARAILHQLDSPVAEWPRFTDTLDERMTYAAHLMVVHGLDLLDRVEHAALANELLTRGAETLEFLSGVNQARLSIPSELTKAAIAYHVAGHHARAYVLVQRLSDQQRQADAFITLILALLQRDVPRLAPNQALNSARLPRWCHRCGSAQMERGGRAVA